MNLDSTALDGLEPEIGAKLASRRDLFSSARRRLGAAAAAPALLATVATQAFAQGLPQQVQDVLNFALTLEYLEDEFYRTAIAKGVVPAEHAATFAQISKHETQHVATLSGALGVAAVAKPKFDFTAGGKYGDIFSNFKTFALVSQTLEDTGVAAYKGQAPTLTGGGALLTTALQIHSVEARHAAAVRLIRGVRPWTAAFDKPLSKAQVLAAATPFIVG